MQTSTVLVFLRQNYYLDLIQNANSPNKNILNFPRIGPLLIKLLRVHMYKAISFIDEEFGREENLAGPWRRRMVCH